MDFHQLTEEARAWAATPGADFEMFCNLEEDRKLIFRSKTNDVTFSIVCCEKKGKWVIWSDQDETLEKLSPTRLFVEACQHNNEKRLSDVLSHANLHLRSLLGAAGVNRQAQNDDDEDEGDDPGMDEDMDDDYYDNIGAGDEDVDEGVDMQQADSSDMGADSFFVGGGSSQAVQRLLKDFRAMKKSGTKFCIDGSPRGNNLFVWDVKLTDFPRDSKLGKDLLDFAAKYHKEPVVYMEMKFPHDYPMSPPFVRVTRPRFKFLTGHVTLGGSVCMQALTKSGWSPGNDIEGILVQIRAEIMSDSGARLDANPDRPYDEAEARQAFERMVQRYGWNKI